jgi:RNA-directed DNA polymerase
MEFLSFHNKIIILCDSPNDFFYFFEILSKFLELRGLYFKDKALVPVLLSKGLIFLSWNLYKNGYFIPFVIVTNKILRLYKSKLKAIVKSSYNKDIVRVLRQLNYEIKKLVNSYFFSDNWSLRACELDIYVHKTLWRYVRRYHPRRTNTWIYSRYWKRFSGIWRFFVIDSSQGRIFFLKSHLSFKSSVFRVANSLNAFNFYNNRKISNLLYKKFEYNFHPNYIFLYKRQRGLCFICKKPICLKNYTLLVNTLNYPKTVSLSNSFFLIHAYCRNNYT